MKALLKRRPRNEPIKSPSPDIANRSIIKNTTIEVEDIRMKFKKAEEKQLKFQLQSSFSHIAPSDHPSIQIKYRQLYDEYHRLKNQLKNIGEQNNHLSKQNNRLLSQSQKNKGISSSAGADYRNQDQSLKDYCLLKEEKRRLELELKLEKEKTIQFLKHNDSLLLDEEPLQPSINQPQRSTEITYRIPISPSAAEEEKRLSFFANNMLTNYETRINAYLNELNSRINKVELMEKMLKERLERDSRAGKTPPSYKANINWAYSTGVKIDSNKEYPLSQQRPNTGFAQTSSPFRVQESQIDIRESNSNLMLYQNMRLKDAEILRLKFEKQKLLSMLNDYQRERAGLVLTPKFREADDNMSKKISYLEQSLRFSKESYEEYSNLNAKIQQRLSVAQQKLSVTEANFQQEKKELNSKIQYQQKIIKQYQEQTNGSGCPQCIHLQEEIGRLMTNFKQTEQRYEQNLNHLRNSVQSQVSKYHQQLQQSQYDYNRKLKQLQDKNQRIVNQNIELHQDNRSHIRMLEYIKNVFQVDDIRDILQQNTDIYTEVETAYKSEVEKYKYLIAGREDEIAEYERKYKLKVTQAQLLTIQLQRVRKQNADLRSHNIKLLSTSSELSRERLQNNRLIFLHNNDHILQKVRTGEQKVEILYQKIKNSGSLNESLPSSSFRADF